MLLRRFALPDDAECRLLNFAADSLGRDQSLSDIGIEQKRRKFFAAESRRRIAASHTFDYAPTDLLQSFAAG